MSRPIRDDNTLHFTEQTVREARPRKGRRTEYRDSRFSGLILRVNLDRRKSKPAISRMWVYRPNRRNEAGKRPGQTLGAWPEMSVNAAIDAWKVADSEFVEDVTLHERIRRRTSALLEDLAKASRSDQVRVLGEIKEVMRRSGISLGDLVTKYVADREAEGISKYDNVKIFYKHVPEDWLTRAAEDVELSEVSDLLSIMKIEKAVPRSANVLYATLKASYEFGWKRGILAQNPMERLEKPVSKIPVRTRVLKEEEIVLIGSELERRNRSFVHHIFWLLLLTGARRVEIVRAKWRCLRTRDLDNEEVPILHIPKTKKDRPYDVILGPTALQIFDDLGKDRRGDYVFPRMDDEHNTIGPSTVTGTMTRLSHRLIKEGKMTEDCCVHDLRRTMTTRLAELGTPKTISKFMINHRISEDTLRHYFHPDLSKVARKWWLLWDHHVGQLRDQALKLTQDSATE